MKSRKLFERITSLATAVAGGCLILLHAALLWRRVAEATILQPAILARWIGSAVLIGLFFALRRFAARHIQRRHLLPVFWLLVVLLHAAIPVEQRLVQQRDLLVAAAAQTGFAVLAVGLLTIGTISLASFFAESGLPGTLFSRPLRAAEFPRSIPRAPPAR